MAALVGIVIGSVGCADAPDPTVAALDRVRAAAYPSTYTFTFRPFAQPLAGCIGVPQPNLVGSVDLDRETLDWGLERRIRPAGEDAESRITLRNANVLEPQPPLVDVAVGLNFSYWCFETRDSLRAYFEAARAGLGPEGVLFLDCYGGTEAPVHEVNEREVVDEDEVVNDGEPFTYIWEQQDFNPLTAHLECRIHFEFEDGSRLDDAFTYSWRMWTLPELRELLLEAGFAAVRVWAEEEDEDGEGTGEFGEVEEFDNEGVWWVYISAENQ